jgi:hypothetical protein
VVNYWVWPVTQTGGVGSCTAAGLGAGEIYRLKASVATPACASVSPQAAIIITAFWDYGIILADNEQSGELIGTPDARGNDDDLSCLTSQPLALTRPSTCDALSS